MSLEKHEKLLIGNFNAQNKQLAVGFTFPLALGCMQAQRVKFHFPIFNNTTQPGLAQGFTVCGGLVGCLHRGLSVCAGFIGGYYVYLFFLFSSNGAPVQFNYSFFHICCLLALHGGFLLFVVHFVVNFCCVYVRFFFSISLIFFSCSLLSLSHYWVSFSLFLFFLYLFASLVSFFRL